MKIRKRVVNGFMAGLVLCSVFMLQGCDNAGQQNAESKVQENAKEDLETISQADNAQKKESILYFSDDVSTIKVTHSNGGGQENWEMDKEDIPQFREWAISLQLEPQSFENSESPGEYNGGDAYSFEISGDVPLNFTYMNIGDDNCYVYTKDTWYLVADNSGIPEFLSDREIQANYTDIKKLPAEYSEDRAIRDGVVVNTLDETFNQEALYRFCDLYSAGKDAMVRVMSYTIEGDPIIEDISYKDNRIIVITDSSRDRFGAGAGQDFEKMQFKHLIEHKGLLYLSKNDSWEDDDFLFAHIDNKDIWKGHLTEFQN